MVSLIHNGSEITTWMVYNFKTESKSNIFKSQATFLRKISFLNFVRLAQRHWSCMPTHKISYFYPCTYEKTYLAVHFTKGCFLSICWQESQLAMLLVLSAKVSITCLLEIQARFLFFPLHKIIMSKSNRLFILYTISYTQCYNVNHINKVFTFLPTHLPAWEQGIPCQLSKQISELFFQMSAQVYSVLGQTEWRRRAFLEWANAQSYLWREGVMLTIIKVLTILFLLKGIENILVIFKINQ